MVNFSTQKSGFVMSPAVTRLAVIGLLAIVSAARGQDAATEELLAQATRLAQRGEHAEAIQRLTELIEKSPMAALAWYLRGREHFRAGKIAESVADFDKFVELAPKKENEQWERGISYYYAGQFDKGAKQFEDYQKFHDQDVENSVWRYLCVARSESVEKARANMLPIQNDPRVPMMQIYDLYRGKLQPDDVLKAARENAPNRELLNQRLFYAQLYIGLWREAAGHADDAKQHILEAE